MSFPVHFALGGADLALGGLDMGLSLVSKLPQLVGGPSFGDMLAQSIGDTDKPAADGDALADAASQSASVLQLNRESAAMSKVLQNRVAGLLEQNGIDFSEGMTVELSSSGRVRVSDHPQAAKIEALLAENQEVKQLITSLLTSQQLLQTQVAPQDGVPDLDDLEIKLRPQWP